MKKPASKLESAIELLSDANNEKGGTNEEQAEEEEAEVDPLLDLDAGRDRSKAKKWFGMLEAGAIPEAAAKAWQACASRGDETRLINSIFDTKGGKLVLQEKFIVPKHYTMQKTITKKENATEMEDGFGKLIFCKKYGLNDEELQQCIQSGEVVTWKSGGLRLYAARNVTLKNEAEKIRRRSWKPTPSRWIKMQVNHSQRSLIRLCQR
jgi:hypothetical protein